MEVRFLSVFLIFSFLIINYSKHSNEQTINWSEKKMFKKKSVYSKYQVLLQLTDTSLNGITFQLFFNLTAIF